MSNVIAAQRAIRDLGVKSQNIMDNPSLTVSQKSTQLKELQAELKTHQDTVLAHKQARQLMVGGSALGASDGLTSLGQSFGAKAYAPRMSLNQDEAQAIFEAARTKQTLKINIETKAPNDVTGLLPAQLIPGIVGLPHEPVRLLDHIPTSAMSGPSIEFISHTGTTGSAGMVAKGALKPEVEFTNVQTVLTARKIAAWTALLDEDLLDFPAFTGYLQNELIRIITDVENNQILNGDGTGENLLGLFNQAGILTRDHAADVTADANATAIDTFDEAIADLRTGPAYVEPDALIINPTTWSKIRRTKNTMGNYVLGDPGQASVSDVWGIPVLATTTCPVGTALLGNLQQGAQAFIRQGFTLETSNQASDAFTTNKTLFRAEERLTLGTARPKALLKITNL